VLTLSAEAEEIGTGEPDNAGNWWVGSVGLFELRKIQLAETRKMRRFAMDPSATSRTPDMIGSFG
jgi:hypothetical protein